MNIKDLNNQAMGFYNQMDYRNALAIGESALEIAETENNNMDLVRILINLGLINHKLHKTQKAINYYKRAIELFEKYFDLDKNEFVECLNYLGVLYENLHFDKDAEKCYDRALLICNGLKTSNHFSEAMTLNNLGAFFIVTENLNSAEPILKKSLAIIDKKSNNNVVLLANIFHNLGWLYSKRGSWEFADSFLRKSLKIKEEILGKDHPYLKNTLSELISVLIKTNKNKAVNLIQKQYNEVIAKISEIRLKNR